MQRVWAVAKQLNKQVAADYYQKAADFAKTMPGIKPISGTMFKSLTGKVFPECRMEFPNKVQRSVKGLRIRSF